MFIDAIHDRHKDLIKVVERDQSGNRVFVDYPVNHTFYYSHGAGSYTSIFGDPCKKYVSTNGQKFRRELKRIKDEKNKQGLPKHKIFESDINPVFRSLAENYTNADAPRLNIGFFDIEVDFHAERGFAPPDDPFNAVTAVSVHLSHLERMITLVLCPPTMTAEQAQAEIDGDPANGIPAIEDTILFVNEDELLRAFITLIQDADILSGWNSEGFDIPYMVNRIRRRLGEPALRDLCLWGQMPREREYVKFGKTANTYDLVGRVHLDYLLLYQKHNTKQEHSYRLDYIGEIEVGENKTPYEGTLDDLYKKDFRKFVLYNRQDTALLVKIDAKRKFIELSNQIAHANCVLLKTTLGSVALVEQAIINDMHAMGFVVPDRKPRDDSAPRAPITPQNFFYDDDDDDDDDDDGRTPVVGAYVAPPKVGIHRHIGAIDINSLYPSAIRALNMSPETIVGQVRMDRTMALVEERIANKTPRAEAWDGIFHTLEVGFMKDKTDDPITIDFEDGTSKTMTGAKLYEYIFNPKNHVCITANGTIFRTDKEGMIPMLLGRWYADRKAMQKKAKEFAALAKEETDPAKKKEHLYWSAFWDQRQLARKILLNSLYGALLNEGLRFYDERLGQSTTLTGRSIVRHMLSRTNQALTGEYDFRGQAIVYADTDSCYFSAVPILENNPAFADFDWSRESFIELYDGIADVVNDSFPEFMDRTFNTGIDRGKLIAAGREIVASTGLFIKKKKYAALVYDLEGTRMDTGNKPGKLKVMGLDLKRADTPKFMQQFLEHVLTSILTGVPKEELYEEVKDFREAFTDRPAWEKGSPKAVKNLTKNKDLLETSRGLKLEGKRKPGTKGKVNMPGHVRASLNWNALRTAHGDRHSMEITDGSRIVVCTLRPNPSNLQSVAYPIDEPHLPAWFRELPFDDDVMENTIIDKKLSNLVGVLNWNLAATRRRDSDEFFF